MQWYEIETRLRRYLRDSDAQVWTSSQLINYFSDAQIELLQRVSGLLGEIGIYPYPPRYDWSHMWTWEEPFIDGTHVQVVTEHQQTIGQVIMHPWEAYYDGDTVEGASDGYRWTHPFEVTAGTPCEPIPIPLDHERYRTRYVAYDDEELQPITEHELASMDRTYRTRTGQPINYWHIDEYSNSIALYPHPATIVVQDEPTQAERVQENDDDVTLPVWFSEQYLSSMETGITIDIVDSSDALFMIFEPISFDVLQGSDEPPLPAWMVKYVEYGALERAYGQDGDGFIPSLRDYWMKRKEIGYMALKTVRSGRLQNRHISIGNTGRTAPRGRLRLPAGYPAI